MIAINRADAIVALDGQQSPIGLQYLTGAAGFKDEFSSLVLV